MESERRLPVGPAFDNLMLFVALLATRGPTTRENRVRFYEHVTDRVLDILVSHPDIFAQHQQDLAGDQELAEFSHEELVDAVNEKAAGRITFDLDQTYLVTQMLHDARAILPYLRARKWVLLFGDNGESRFIAGDCPVLLHDGGFGMKESIVILPLGSHFALWGTFDGPEGVIPADRDIHGIINAQTIAQAERWLYSSTPTFEAKFDETFVGSDELLQGSANGARN